MILSQDNNKNYYPESVPIRLKILHQVEIQKTPKGRFFGGRTYFEFFKFYLIIAIIVI